MVDHLQSVSEGSNTAVAFVYFDYKNKETQNISAVLSNILRQLLEELEDVPKEITQYYEASFSERKHSDISIDLGLSFIEITRQRFDQVFLIFDALDECPAYDSNANELRSRMLATVQRVSRYTTVFATSRPSIDLKQDIPDCVCFEIKATTGDVCAYLEARIANHEVLRRIANQNTALKHELIETICNKANGMLVVSREIPAFMADSLQVPSCPASDGLLNSTDKCSGYS